MTTAPAPLPERLTATRTEELEPHHAEMIAATLPLVGANIDAITTEFYRRLFADHPELLRNLFNRSNQAQGAQQRALAASIATYATHLIDPALDDPAELLGRIGHKHASLGVTADQYPLVHTHLFAAIVEVLGADTVTADVAAAWDRVYWLMANTLIDLERRLYADADVPAGDVFRRARVTARTGDPSGTVVLTVAAIAGSFPAFLPGQYVSVGTTLPDGARQIRQYSLINTPGSGELTFAVRPVAATTDAPAGEVSTHLAGHVAVGDELDVSIPFGDLPVGSVGSRPLVLISAGIGITPMIGILEHLAAHAPGSRVQALHADRSPQAHPLRQRQRQLIDELAGGSLEVWYETAAPEEPSVHAGLMQVEAITFDEDAEFFVCGNTGFVQAVRGQLLARGVTPDRVHCELFSPNDWLLG